MNKSELSEGPTPSPITTHKPGGSDLISIFGKERKLLIRVNRDGTLEYGEGYTPDEAARLFWEALAHEGFLRMVAFGSGFARMAP